VGLGTCATLVVVSLAVGYLAGSTLARGPTTRELPTPQPRTPEKPPDDPQEQDGEESGSDEEDVNEDLSRVQAGMFEECKLVLVVRSDLGMTKGKIAAQCSHATLACYKALEKLNPNLLRHWERTGQAKVALKCDDEEQMLLLEATARSLNLCARSIHDAGRTQIAAGSRTVLGIGPGPVKLVNEVTGKLRLL